MGPTMINNQGAARGIEKGPKQREDEVSEKQTIVERIKAGTKTIFRSLLWSAVILSIEALVIWKAWNYVLEGYELTYWKTYLLILTVRLMFRNTVMDKKI